MGYTRATTVKGGPRYEHPKDVKHGFFNQGYKSRGTVVIRRSNNGALSWPAREESTVYESRMPVHEKRAFLARAGSGREEFDMFRADSLFYFGRAFIPETENKGSMGMTCFAIRSQDKGKTWESIPTIIKHPFSRNGSVHKDAYPVIRMPDGQTLLGAMSLNVERRGPAVFASTDQGLTWDYISQPVYDARKRSKGRFTYANLLRRPHGDLHCYYLHIDRDDEVKGLKNAIAVSISKDGGRTWGEPTPIVGQGQSCWQNPGTSGNSYRSPWPIQLADGRILVMFARRRRPYGIGGVVSKDDGKTWSHEFVLRDDASKSDLGYPVGCQLEDGRIFTGYYYTLSDGNAFGGTRFIAGSTFRLD